MYSKFWENVREQLKDKKGGQKWLAEASGVGRTAINSGIARNSSPTADNAYAISRVFGVSIEELLDGKTGVEYVRGLVRNDPMAIQVPDRIRDIVDNLLLIDDNNLVGIRASAEALANTKKGTALGTAG